MRFEPDDYLTTPDHSMYTARVRISSYPAFISSVFVIALTILSFFVDVASLTFFLLILTYVLQFSRLFCMLFFCLSFFVRFMGKIEITHRTVQGMYMPYTHFRSFFVPISEIERVEVSAGIFGRAFGYGSLLLFTKDKKLRLPFIQNPKAVKEYLEKLRKSQGIGY